MLLFCSQHKSLSGLDWQVSFPHACFVLMPGFAISSKVPRTRRHVELYRFETNLMCCLTPGVPAKRQHPYRREAPQTPMESRQTRKMTRSVSLGSNLVRSPCVAASAPVKKEPVELEVNRTLLRPQHVQSPTLSTSCMHMCLCLSALPVWACELLHLFIANVLSCWYFQLKGHSLLLLHKAGMWT